MTLSLLNLIKAGPPPPKVVLLPDALFFTRAIPVATDAGAAAVAEQVELALETLSPFPPSQLYHGFFWQPGAQRALIFAAYRRRFTTDQVADWENAELVLPSFAALLGGEAKPESTIVVPSEGGLTALYYDGDSIPTRVAFHALAAEATEDERNRAREQMLAAAPDSRRIVLGAAPIPTSSRNEREIAFRSEGFVSRIPLAQAAAVDVRDKAELAALRRSRRRDLGLWRGFVGLVIALLILGLGELALVGLRVWDRTLQSRFNAQQPVVEKIETAQTLTTRINELSSKRLLPIEMIVFVAGTKPEAVQFLRTSTSGLYSLVVEAVSTSPAAISEYRAKLVAMPEIENLELRGPESRNNGFGFTMTITFRPGALKPAGTTP